MFLGLLDELESFTEGKLELNRKLESKTRAGKHLKAPFTPFFWRIICDAPENFAKGGGIVHSQSETSN